MHTQQTLKSTITHIEAFKRSERIIVLRKSKSILEELLVHTDNDFSYAAMCVSIKKINDEISALTHQS